MAPAHALSRSLATAMLLFSAMIGSAVAGDPSIPDKLTGATGCIAPIRMLICTVDSSSGFVAGIEYSMGPVFGVRAVCSRGERDRLSAAGRAAATMQTTWNMANPLDPSFPKNKSGLPDLQYFYPLSALTSQMLVLQAANPNGPTFGNIAAVVFRYYAPDTARVGYAVCGNARYANAYLFPLTAPPAPAVVTLKSVFVSPLSETEPAFLASFSGKCYQRGFGFLGGDPYASSKFHVLSLGKACFAPVALPVVVPPPAVTPVPPVNYDWDVPYAPCFHDNKAGAKDSASVSCALTGRSVLTGKYGVISVNASGSAVQAVPAPGGGPGLVAAPYGGQPYLGDEPGGAL